MHYRALPASPGPRTQPESKAWRIQHQDFVFPNCCPDFESCPSSDCCARVNSSASSDRCPSFVVFLRRKGTRIPMGLLQLQRN